LCRTRCKRAAVARWGERGADFTSSRAESLKSTSEPKRMRLTKDKTEEKKKTPQHTKGQIERGLFSGRGLGKGDVVVGKGFKKKGCCSK